MIDISKGKFWDKPWSLVDGCTPCSPGCDHCWSAGMTQRFGTRSTLDPYISSLCTPTGKFNGDIVTHPERLSIPLKRRKPTVYAVWNDLFHEAVPDEFIDASLKTMITRPDHTFFVLTKRHQRMASFYSPLPGSIFSGHYQPTSNIYHGLTVCNQQEADEKIPEFLQVPGKKFLSIEPMLGLVDLRDEHFQFGGTDPFWRLRHIDAVILGGETGPGARPIHPDWVRSVRDQCAAAGVPFFFKGWGAWIPVEEMGTVRYEKNKTHSGIIDMETHDELPWVKP